MQRRSFLAGVLGLALLPTSKLLAAVSEKATAPAPVIKTRKLVASYTPELAQDLRAVHGISVEQELKLLLRDELEREIGRHERGEITTKLVYDPHSFAPRYQMTFRNNGKYSAEELWGMKL